MTKITKITIGRTIPMAKYANEKQEVEVVLSDDPNMSLEEKVKEARTNAEKAFLLMYPKYGTVEHKEYIDHMNNVKRSLYPPVNAAEKTNEMPEEPQSTEAKNMLGSNPENPSTEKVKINVKF